MFRALGTFVVVAVFAAGAAYAQEAGIGGGRVEISAFPGGGFTFIESDNGDEPDFTNFAVGGSLTANLNRWVGLEGEIGWAPGVHQRVSFDAQTFDDQHTPCMFGYNASVVVSPFGNNRGLVPYVSGGMGGLMLLDIKEVANLGITDRTTFVTATAGGGLKWFASRHWGVRADYRLFMVKQNDTAPAFFGQENRYGHRVYGGLVLTY
jgi:opacity protein-like surface antigen